MMEIQRVESGNDLKALWGKKEILLNPLGAGDTCSGVFMLEYMETRVSKFISIWKLLGLTHILYIHFHVSRTQLKLSDTV